MILTVAGFLFYNLFCFLRRTIFILQRHTSVHFCTNHIAKTNLEFFFNALDRCNIIIITVKQLYCGFVITPRSTVLDLNHARVYKSNIILM